MVTPAAEQPPEAFDLHVGLVDEPELVRLGVAAMLEQQSSPLARLTLADTAASTSADLVLCDPSGRDASVEQYLAAIAARTSAPLVAFTWETDPTLVRRILSAGARAWVPKAVSAARLVETLLAVCRGSARHLTVPQRPAAIRLSRREREVLTLICRGHSNAEIAEQLYVSVNSVKTYVRQVYQKTGVARRAQAVAWGLENGY